MIEMMGANNRLLFWLLLNEVQDDNHPFPSFFVWPLKTHDCVSYTSVYQRIWYVYISEKDKEFFSLEGLQKPVPSLQVQRCLESDTWFKLDRVDAGWPHDRCIILTPRSSFSITNMINTYIIIKFKLNYVTGEHDH